MSPLPLEPAVEGEASASEENSGENDEELFGVDITPDKDGGVRKKILQEGEGDSKPIAGYKASVNYIGKFLDGTEFDSSRIVGGPFEFVLGHGSVIKGWEICVPTMRKGEVCIVTCQPEYAYGKAGSTKIPPDTPLQFEIELISWRGEDVSSDGSVMKAILQKGVGHDRPNTGADVHVHLKGICDGRVFEERDVNFCLGEGQELGIVPGLEKAIGKMNKEEKAMVTIKHGKYGFGPEGSPELGVPPGATLEYEVEIKDFVKFKEIWDMTNEEKIEAAEQVKQKGTSYFKKGKYKIAINQYNKVIACLEGYFNDEEKAQRDPIALAGHLNLAACHLKLTHFNKCISECNKALEMDEDNVKAFFRRGKARIGTSDYELAKRDFYKVLQLDPKNREAVEQISIVNKKLKVFNAQQRKIFANMFDKFAKQDEVVSQPTKDVFEQAENEAPSDEQMNEEEKKNESNTSGIELEKGIENKDEDLNKTENTSEENVVTT